MAEDQPQAEISPEPPIEPIAAPPAEGDVSDELSLPNPLVLAALGLVLLSVITFLPTLRGEGTWLDDVSLTDNSFVQAPDGVARFWASADRAGRYQPLTLTSFWLEYRLFQDSLAAAHFINILLHAAVVLLLWLLLRRLDVPGAWLAAAAFAVHPVHTQAIAWISGRSVVLASMFYLSALLVYLRFLGLTPAAEEKTLFTLPPEPERLWGLAFVLFLCAVAANAAATVTFPIAIMIILWWKRDAITPKQLGGILPFFLAAIAAGAWVAWLQVTSLASRAIAVAFGFTSAPGLLFVGVRAVGFYALKLIVPYPLIFDYPRWTPEAGLGILCGLVLVAALSVLWLFRARIGRAPLAAALLFLVALAPMLNLLDPQATRYSFVADFRQYLASASLIALVAAAATQVVMSEQLREKVNPSYCAGAVLVVLAALSFHQGTFYLNSQNLWNHTVTDNKASVLGAEGYGDAMLGSGQFFVAQRWYEKAQSLAPKDPRAAVGLGTIAGAIGYEDAADGHPELTATQQTSAEQYFHDAIRLDPDYKPAYVALARLYTLNHNDLGAIDLLKEAVRIDPESLRTRLDLGAAQRRVGQLKEAEQTLTDLLDDAPNVSAVHTELGNVYIEQHNLSGALAQWQKALQLDPTNTTVMLNFGELLDSSGDTELAAKQFLAATMVDPSLVQAHVYLAHVYSKLSHRHDAVLELYKAIALDPSNPQAQNALAKAMEDEKRLGPGVPAASQPTLTPAADATSQPAPNNDLFSPTPAPDAKPATP